MRLKISVALAALAILTLSAHNVMADVVAVSSFTVTTVSGSNSGRQELCVQNTTTNPVYLSKTSAGATVAAGLVLVSSATNQTPICLSGFKGALYGLAGAGAVGSVRTLETLR